MAAILNHLSLATSAAGGARGDELVRFLGTGRFAPVQALQAARSGQAAFGSPSVSVVLGIPKGFAASGAPVAPLSLTLTGGDGRTRCTGGDRSYPAPTQRVRFLWKMEELGESCRTLAFLPGDDTTVILDDIAKTAGLSVNLLARMMEGYPMFTDERGDQDGFRVMWLPWLRAVDIGTAFVQVAAERQEGYIRADSVVSAIVSLKVMGEYSLEVPPPPYAGFVPASSEKLMRVDEKLAFFKELAGEFGRRYNALEEAVAKRYGNCI